MQNHCLVFFNTTSNDLQKLKQIESQAGYTLYTWPVNYEGFRRFQSVVYISPTYSYKEHHALQKTLYCDARGFGLVFIFSYKRGDQHQITAKHEPTWFMTNTCMNEHYSYLKVTTRGNKWQLVKSALMYRMYCNVKSPPSIYALWRVFWLHAQACLT